MRLTRGPRENGHRPAADPLFRSAARARAERVIGVVLSGLLVVGAGGLRLIKERGGATVVQDPEDALFDGMPRAALAACEVDSVVPIDRMARALAELVEQPVDPAPGPALDTPDLVEREPAVTRGRQAGPPSALTCPECGGALWEHDEDGHIRYACHVGHAYSLGSLLEEQGRSLEMSLWSALRALEERADMQRRLARRSRPGARARFDEHAADAERHATALRQMLAVVGRLTLPAAEIERV
jgi:two-component system chemotaxis response regulator CheB